MGRLFAVWRSDHASGVSHDSRASPWASTDPHEPLGRSALGRPLDSEARLARPPQLDRSAADVFHIPDVAFGVGPPRPVKVVVFARGRLGGTP